MAKQARQKKELGKGLKSLLGGMEMDMSKNEEVVKELSNTIAMIPIRLIDRNPEQPRQKFDQEALDELSTSIKTYGLIQPITVRHIPKSDRYQIISGERRTRASQQAGLKEIPAYIRLANDQVMMEMALVENIQRENLDPIEIAVTYERLKDEFKLTHEQLSDRVGKKRSTITNYLSLLNLPDFIKKGIKENQFSQGHAKAIKGVTSEIVQRGLYKRALKEELSVRELEHLVKIIKGIDKIEDRGLLDVLKYKVEDLDLSTEDLTLLVQCLQKIDDSLLRKQLFERVLDADDKLSIQDLVDVVNFIQTIEDGELKEALYREIGEERSSIMHLAAFAERYLTKKAKTSNKGGKTNKVKAPRLSTEYQAQEDFLKTYLEVPVTLKVKEDGGGMITIPFKGVDDFNDILDRIKGE